jgi:hypothetical protein
MASSSKVRHTVLRLIGFPSTFCVRNVRSSKDWRLIGSPVSATRSQARALTNARSRGGKIGLAAASRAILQGEISRSPAFPPAMNLSTRESHMAAKPLLIPVGMFMDQQHQL